MPSFESLIQINPTLLFSGGLLGVLIIAFLIALPMLERRIPILKALALTRRLKSAPVIGAYYSQVRSVNAQISEVWDQGAQLSEEKMRLEKAWDKTVSQNGGHDGSAQNKQRPSDGNQVDKREISNGNSGGWSPQRSGMAQPGHRSGPAPRGFMPPAAKNQPLPQSGGQTMVTWALAEKKLLAAQQEEKGLPYDPPIGRIPVPPEFDVNIENSSKMREAALLGRRIERYQVDAILHEGELSHVYQTYDMKIGRLVALKLMRFPDYLTREGRISIFEDMRTLSSADHPNLTHIYDFGEDEGRLFVVSQLVKGVPIHTHLEHMMLQGLPVELGPILETVANVSGALAEVHDLQLVHGLIKPGHLLLEPISATNRAFDVKLLDVGLINLYPTIREVPSSFWPYLSPEYCLTGRVDSRSDIYSIGALLYHLLTGQPPFNPTSADQAVQLHNWTDPISPTDFNKTLPDVVEKIILKALAKEPNDRFQSALELKDALLAAANPVTGRYEDRKFLKEGDRLLTVTAPGQGRKTIVIDQSTSFAGSGADNDIILTGVDISDRHMRLDIDGPNFVVTNISSKNTIYLQGVRMLPDLPEIWEEGDPIQVGAYTISWEEIVEDHAVMPPLFDTLLDKLVGITMQPATLELAPGEFGDIQISLINQASHVDEFEIQVEHLPEGWVKLSANNLSLLPGDQTPTVLNISVPIGSDVTPKDYPFVIRVIPASYPEHAVSTNANLRIKPIVKVESEISPPILRNRGSLNLRVTSLGNALTTLTVKISEESNPLFFNFDRKPFKIRPNEVRNVEIMARPFRRPIIGYVRPVPFTVQVQAESGDEVHSEHQVQGTIAPYLPVWSLSLIGFLLILLFVAYPTVQSFFASEETDEAAVAAVADEAANGDFSTATGEDAAGAGFGQSSDLPLTCADYKALNPDADDGEVELFVSRLEQYPVMIYCHNMAGTPSEYLTVDSAVSLTNYSSVIKEDIVGQTYFDRIRIDMTTLQIDRTDLTFSRIRDAALQEADVIRDFATALGCQDGVDPNGIAQAQIDLSETPFVIHESTSFEVQGIEASGEAIISEDRKRATLDVTGQCGWIWPAADLQLAYLIVN